jgi:hypothetical protein
VPYPWRGSSDTVLTTSNKFGMLPHDLDNMLKETSEIGMVRPPLAGHYIAGQRAVRFRMRRRP